MRKWVLVSSLVGLMAILPMTGHAITTICGPNICYKYDETQAAQAYFGLPTLVGDAMRFLPANFKAESLNGQGVVSTTATWVFDRVYSVSGAEIASIVIREAGDYFISGDSGAPDTVSANLYTLVTDNVSAEVAFNIKNFSASGNTVTPPQPWALVSDPISPAAAFAAIANDVAVLIQNTLTASTDQANAQAFIQKKFVVEIGTIVPTVIPVPAAVWLLGSAFGVLTLVRRRAA